jgi:signal transduction histidine kinase
MGFIEFIITNDKAQGIRIKRQLMASLLWFAIFSLVFLSLKAGLLRMSLTQLLTSFFLALLGQGLFFVCIRTSLNKHFKDPSLTIPQIVWAIFWITYLLYHTQELRGLFMAGYLFAILFGVFQLSAKEFMIVSFLAVAAYGCVIIIDNHNQAPDFGLAINIVQWCSLAVMLSYLSFIGNYIKGIREKLKFSKSQLEISYQEIFSQKERIEERTSKLTSMNQQLEQEIRERNAAEEKLNESLLNLRQTQTQLVQTDKMAALGDLVAGVAHEINTPLGVGLTAASLLSDKTSDYRDLFEQDRLKRSDLEKYFSIAKDSSDMILTNLNQAAGLVQSFKQVAVDQSSESRRRFNVKTYLNELLFSLRPRFTKVHHTIDLHCDEDIEIDSYPGVFSQIITNLVMNSLIHGFDGLTEGKIILTVWREDRKLVVSYSDNGKGMEQKILDKMFDPFFTTKRNQGGTGLGMHIVYNLVTQTLKGELECISTPEKGTTFLIRVSLPSDNKRISQTGK